MQLPASLLQAIERYLAGTASPEEEQLANDWYHSFRDREIDIPADIVHLRAEMEKRIWKRLLDTVNTSDRNEPRPIVHLQRRKWGRLAAAAIVLLVVTACAFLFFEHSSTQKDLARADSRAPKNDVPPGGNKATLTLGNGATIVLDSAQNGALTQQGNTKIEKLDSGLLAYHASGESTSAVLYNTLSTPYGGQFRLVLPDGSKVWLNAASSIKYPTAFTGNQRKVTITGEAYFEIANDASKPFSVSVNDMEIAVLGTRFNVMAYADEADTRTTLLEGAVKLTRGGTATLLKPGQLVSVSSSGDGVQVVNNADIDEVMAWKEGFFQFSKADVQTVMRQVARWYDVKVMYDGTVSQHFNGRIPRSTSAATLFKVLELAGGVHFKLEGRRITVMP